MVAVDRGYANEQCAPRSGFYRAHARSPCCPAAGQDAAASRRSGAAESLPFRSRAASFARRSRRRTPAGLARIPDPPSAPTARPLPLLFRPHSRLAECQSLATIQLERVSWRSSFSAHGRQRSGLASLKFRRSVRKVLTQNRIVSTTASTKSEGRPQTDFESRVWSRTRGALINAGSR